MKALIQDDVRHGLRIAPLVDIVFLLLVFFLVATTFYEGERDLTVSLADGAAGEERVEDDVTVINIRDDGEVRVGGLVVDGPQLRSTLEQLVAEGGGSVIIRCDRGERHDAFVQVLEACQLSGVMQVGVATRPRE